MTPLDELLDVWYRRDQRYRLRHVRLTPGQLDTVRRWRLVEAYQVRRDAMNEAVVTAVNWLPPTVRPHL